jgi:hypothetical protein
MLPRRAGLALVLLVSFSREASAVPPKKAEKPNPAREAVVKSLRHEVVAAIDRRSELAEALARHPDVPSLYWQSGYFREGGTWRPVEQAGQSSADDPTLVDYRDRRDAAPKTMAGQVELADWCRDHKLSDQERAHLRAAMELSPGADHSAILERLGYAQFGNQWLSREQVEQWQSLNRRTTAALKAWGTKLDKIIERLDGSPRQHESAVASLKQLTDPDVIPVLEYVLCGRDEPSAAAAVAAFANMQGHDGTLALARQAVYSPWTDVREQATTALKSRTFEDFVPGLVGLLVTPVTKKVSPPKWYYFDFPRDSQGTTGQLVLVTGYILAQETDDQFRVAVINQVDYRLNEALEGYFVRFRGGFHIEPKQQSSSSNGVNAYVAQLRGTRTLNDGTRNIAADTYLKNRQVELEVDAVNERTAELNRRIIRALASVTGRDPNPDPAAWWQWWGDFTDTQQIGAKAVVRVEETQSLGNPASRVQRRSCFAAGTRVLTESGQAAIETIKVGDRVLAQDIDTGELTYKAVLCTTIRPAKPLVRVSIGDEAITATGGHRFWVSGEGWTKARDLRPGSLVHTVRGSAAVGSVESGSTEETYNLVVDGLHNYFVGQAGFLVQDLPLPQPTNVIVPGLARRQLAAATR